MRLLILPIIRLYRLCLSPMLPVACRFTPTCSVYAEEAVKAHGAVKGSWLSFKRLCRCHPFASAGFDPVPHDCKEAHE